MTLFRLTALAAALCLATAATAQDTGLRALMTGDTARGFEAVGRIDIDGRGFCTGALISETQVLTAAHCVHDAAGQLVDPGRLQFLAGLRNGRAAAYRGVRRIASDPDWIPQSEGDVRNVGQDVAILELDQPIRALNLQPYELGPHPRAGSEVGVVSYARDRAEAPSLQRVCRVLGQEEAVLVMSCDVDFGSSGAPVFAFGSGGPRIVAVVAAKAQTDQGRIALGARLDETVDALRAELRSGGGTVADVPQATIRMIRPDGMRSDDTGAKFVHP